MELLVGHFQEAGLNSALERQTRACQQELLDFVPQEKHLRSIQDQMASFGVAIGRERLREMLSLPYDKKLSAISQVETRGVHGSANRTIAALRLAAKRLEQHESSSIGVPVGLEELTDEDDQSTREQICKALNEALAFLAFVAACCAVLGAPEAAALVLVLYGLLYIIESIIC
jgi:hypothetical protein